MVLSEEFSKILDQNFDWKLTNVPELENPVLVVLEYSPRSDQRPVSIAFDCSGGAKCWLSEPEIKLIGDQGPSAHEKYKRFVYRGCKFYPYSIESFPQTIFRDIQEFNDACRSLYQHIKE